MDKKPSVLIIGAGVAGVAAASKLIQNDFDQVTILEAEDRIGGRIWSVEFEGSVVDLGAQWVHGQEGNVVYEMVKDLDLLSSSFNDYNETTFLCPNLKLVNNYAPVLHQIGLEVIDDKEMALKYPGSWGDYFINVFHERVVAEYPNNSEVLVVAKLLEEWFSKYVVCFDSAKTWFDFTTHGAFVFKACPGDQQLNWRDKGYRTIFDVLMKKIPDITKKLPLEDKILLNKEVTKINWDLPDKSVAIVECSDGTSYMADHVIVTISVGALKKIHTSLFSPQLPPFKVNSINGITLGTVNKILLKFPNAWWHKGTKGFSILWSEDDKKNLREEFCHFEPSSDGVSWLEEIFGFYVVDSHPNVLLGWVVGRNAESVEYLSDEVVISGCMYLLRKFVGDEYDIPEPDNILRSKWSTNPHFCGSYVYVSKESERLKASAEDLLRPLCSKNGKETLLFAGEATSPNRYSTVNGAIETGHREAERLINLYK